MEEEDRLFRLHKPDRGGSVEVETKSEDEVILYCYCNFHKQSRPSSPPVTTVDVCTIPVSFQRQEAIENQRTATSKLAQRTMSAWPFPPSVLPPTPGSTCSNTQFVGSLQLIIPISPLSFGRKLSFVREKIQVGKMTHFWVPTNRHTPFRTGLKCAETK